MRTKLQGGTVVGFNGHTHVLIRDGVVVWEDDRITFVGQAYEGPVDRTLQASERLIMPGLIDLHWHAGVRAKLLARAPRSAEAYWAAYPQWSWDGRSVAETFPNAFPWVEGYM